MNTRAFKIEHFKRQIVNMLKIDVSGHKVAMYQRLFLRQLVIAVAAALVLEGTAGTASASRNHSSSSRLRGFQNGNFLIIFYVISLFLYEK